MDVSTSGGGFRSLRPWLALAFGGGGGAVLVVLLARTAVGAVDASPPPWLTAIVTAAGFAVAMGVWRLDDLDRATHDRSSRITRLVAAWLAAVLFGLLVSRESSAGVAAVAAVALTWACAAASYVLRSVEVGSESPVRPLSVANTLAGLPSGEAQAHGPAPEFAPAEIDESALRLQLRRSMTADGETIEIQARLEFAAGAREAVLHVPFWPALASPPHVECEPLDSEEVELRCTSAERYGLRIEARLPAATVTAGSVLIGVEIRAAAARGGLSAAA